MHHPQDEIDTPLAEISCLQKGNLELPPSCLEFCPAHPDFFVVGTYYLELDGEQNDENARPQSRNGSLVMYRLENARVKHEYTLAQPSAVLDLHFQPYQDAQDVCAVVNSTAVLSLFQLCPTAVDAAPAAPAEPLRLLALHRISGVSEDVLFLSCAWHPTLAGLIAISTSTGAVYLLRLSRYGKSAAEAEAPILTHALETWCVAFQPHGSAESQDVRAAFTLYSGADDSILQYLRCETASQSAIDGNPASDLEVQTQQSPVKIKGHTAGVTAILPLPVVFSDGTSLIATGSYDEVLRVYAVREPGIELGRKRWELLTELHLGGGVWRLKLIDVTQHGGDHAADPGSRPWRVRILASCMHAGARLVVVMGIGDVVEACHAKILGAFCEHRSMNYASDFQPRGASGRLVCVSTSFYDKLLCLWSMDLGG